MEAARWNRLDRICGMESALAVKFGQLLATRNDKPAGKKTATLEQIAAMAVVVDYRRNDGRPRGG